MRKRKDRFHDDGVVAVDAVADSLQLGEEGGAVDEATLVGLEKEPSLRPLVAEIRAHQGAGPKPKPPDYRCARRWMG